MYARNIHSHTHRCEDNDIESEDTSDSSNGCKNALARFVMVEMPEKIARELGDRST
ncbi:MAG: hypothetical protein HC764_25940 [Pleurocapsa sp. CRU_1_2]|nr:hypothetical protein [Pleurocapsa sp. CRU_1_2]